MKARLEPRINLVGRTPLETVIPLATPFIVFVDPASSCNFKCTFCPTGHRDMIAETGRFQGVMKLELFQKIVDDLSAFEKPIKVLRMYKDGEPFLNKRFAEHTLKLFEKHGMRNEMYWIPTDEARKDNTLIYILSHDSQEAADKSWKAFLADPDRIKARDASEADGKILATPPERVFMKLTDYSPKR